MKHVIDVTPALFIKVATRTLHWAFERIEDEGKRLGIDPEQVHALIADITLKHLEAVGKQP